MVLERVQRLAHRREQNRVPGKFASEFVNCVARHLAPCLVSALRTHRSSSFTRNAVAVANPRSSNSLRADLLLAAPSLQALENRSPGSLGKFDLPGFETPDLVEGFGENPDYMEPVYGYRGIFEGASAAARKAGDMSHTTSTTFSGLP